MAFNISLLFLISSIDAYRVCKDSIFNMTQVVTTQPGVTVAGQQTQVLRDWNSGLFACFDDMGSCEYIVP